jgi:DNA-binding XRE family transcriptional regulator
MKLEQYLRLTQQSDETFGKLIGLEKSTIWRIRKGKVFPSWATMLRIKAATNGAVEPNDFEPSPENEAIE